MDGKFSFSLTNLEEGTHMYDEVDKQCRGQKIILFGFSPLPGILFLAHIIPYIDFLNAV